MTDTIPPPRPPASGPLPAATAPDVTAPDVAAPGAVPGSPLAGGAAPATAVLDAPGATGPGKPAAPRQRDAFFDNAKFFTAALVVVGHVWAEYGDSVAARAAYVVLYGFHMPVFVFIAGYFSRGFMRSTEKFRSIFPTLIIPYVIFILLYRAQLILINDVSFSLRELFRPHFLMWFLIAMVFWRLSAPLWGHLRHPVLISVALSLAAGCWAFTADSTLSRTAGLLPIFVLGLTIEPRHIQWLRRSWTRWAGLTVLAAALPVAYIWEKGVVAPRMDRGFILWNKGYEDMGFGALLGSGYRLAALAFAVFLGAAFLAVIPRGHSWYTRMGTRSLYVYLLHGLIVKTFDYTGVLAEPVLHTPLGLVGVTLAAAALGVVLATAPVERFTHWAVEPKARWLLKPSHGRT
ncbi:acyltransferase family protein [Actinomadura sp. 7K534]|uniref:acyltransferase family protein n=1 Tax=Actinomadura sp. 7K534 TaxID=2530366 RepID=UPI00104A63AF|nr:acyltransferase family protein [Actinomadura sp. 7K534]TDB94518.1 acyltransferase [Actinomadura sp. 7K534]